MDIVKKQEGNKLTVSVSDRLNTNTAPQLDAALSAPGVLDNINELVLDFGDLVYVSSAGLRVILSAQKFMSRKGGSLVIRNVEPQIYDTFEMTGFLDFLTIE